MDLGEVWEKKVEKLATRKWIWKKNDLFKLKPGAFFRNTTKEHKICVLKSLINTHNLKDNEQM